MKRANGTGSIYKRSGKNHRKPYLVYAPAYVLNGKKNQPFIGSFAKLKEAQEALDSYNRNPNILREKLTFEQIHEEYITTRRYNELSKTQKDCYRAAYRKCVELYNIPFSQIRTHHLQKIIDDIESDGKKLATMQKMKSFLSVLYKHALQSDTVLKDYSAFVQLPKQEKSEKRALTDIEIAKIHKAAINGNKAAKWTMYLICSGWRISEMLELTKFNYDSKERCFIGGKKTSAGKNRTVPVLSSVQWIVDEQLSQNGDTVFCMPDGHAMTADYFRKKMFNPMLIELNIDTSITPHIARHTFSSLLKEKGADDFYRKRLLGHSCGNVTDDVYTHTNINELRQTVELLKSA